MAGLRVSGVFSVVAIGGSGAVPARPRWRISGLVLAVVLALAGAGVLVPSSARAAGSAAVVAWGQNDVGQATVPAGLSGVTAIAGGELHAVALKSDGTVVAWGSNNGQLDVPAGLSGVTAIAAGYTYSLALKSDGTVVPWGYDSGTGAASVPVGLSGVTAIAASVFHSLALKSDGTVVAWGSNDSGESTVPDGLSGVIAIAAGDNHSLAVKSDGTVVAWGNNAYGQTTVPEGLSGVTAVAAGGSFSMALKNDGTVVVWGATDPGHPAPEGLSGVIAIAAGRSHNLALKNDGTVVAWGDSSFGKTSVPTGLSEVTAIAAGGSFSMAIGVLPLAPQKVKFTSTPGVVKTGDTYRPTAKGGASGNRVRFSAAGGCTFANGKVQFAHATTCTVTAAQAGSDGYAPGSATQVIEVQRAQPGVRFTTTPPRNPSPGDTYRPSAKGNPDGPAVVITASGACEMKSKSVATFTKKGQCTLRATQAQTADYERGQDTQTATVR